MEGRVFAIITERELETVGFCCGLVVFTDCGQLYPGMLETSRFPRHMDVETPLNEGCACSDSTSFDCSSLHTRTYTRTMCNSYQCLTVDQCLGMRRDRGCSRPTGSRLLGRLRVAPGHAHKYAGGTFSKITNRGDSELAFASIRYSRPHRPLLYCYRHPCSIIYRAPAASRQPPAMSETAPRAKRKRSAIACVSCHSRKVRCNAAHQGIPCSNCLEDGVKCEIYRRSPQMYLIFSRLSNRAPQLTLRQPEEKTQCRGAPSA